ncbi:MAG: hypothetical protein QME51_02065 [Planctomycetota bacterium]|nr:hypothetical protein [Planctomycetota bacterium]MDI6787138.1 hypothetical protein [Planctomycetota bacterium]
MNTYGDAYERVRTFIESAENLPRDVVESRVKEIENDIYTLFNKLEKLHAEHPELKEIDLSEDFYTLVRMLESKRVIKKYPLLARAVALL